jgi:hypothetical protein
MSVPLTPDRATAREWLLRELSHRTEADLFARYVLPRLEHGPPRF